MSATEIPALSETRRFHAHLSLLHACSDQGHPGATPVPEDRGRRCWNCSPPAGRPASRVRASPGNPLPARYRFRRRGSRASLSARPGWGHHAKTATSSRQRGHETAGQRVRGITMAATEVIIVAAIFIIGAVAGLVAVVGIGIRHEELLFREERRYREAQDSWPGPDGPNQFFSAVPPGLVCHGARALTGLWIRRERGADPIAI